MQTTTMIRSLCVQSAVRVGMLERGARCALCVLVADTTVTLSHRLPACFALPDLSLHQDLPAARSVQRVSMTLTLILLPHARVAQLVSTQQQGRHLARTAQPDMWTMTVMLLQSAWSALWVDMLEQGARHVEHAAQVGFPLPQALRFALCATVAT